MFARASQRVVVVCRSSYPCSALATVPASVSRAAPSRLRPRSAAALALSALALSGAAWVLAHHAPAAVPAAARASAAPRATELNGLWTANSRTYQRADGRLEARIFSQPVN